MDREKRAAEWHGHINVDLLQQAARLLAERLEHVDVFLACTSESMFLVLELGVATVDDYEARRRAVLDFEVERSESRVDVLMVRHATVDGQPALESLRPGERRSMRLLLSQSRDVE